ncbi:hypothetical protein DFH06DRAFT_1340404 [Mycena polygramma]|nr:hypothetical protein DFH06DRAFT_1340404 [Mycena polygramma]
MNDDGAAEGSQDNYEPWSPVLSESTVSPPPAEDDPPIAPTEELEVAAHDLDEKKKKGQKTHHKDPPKAATSKPAASAPAADTSKPTKKTKLAEFSEIAKNEEKTRAGIGAAPDVPDNRNDGGQRPAEHKRAKPEEKMQKYKLKELKGRQDHKLFSHYLSSDASHYSSSGHNDYDFGNYEPLGIDYTLDYTKDFGAGGLDVSLYNPFPDA